MSQSSPATLQEESEFAPESLFASPEGRKILTCMQCGMCTATCPYGDVMEFPPRRIIATLREGDMERVLTSSSLLNCVACYACMAKCPRGIRLGEVLLPVVKEQVLLRLKDIPAELQKALQNMLAYGNPEGMSPRKRADWVKDAGVPVRILPEDPRPTDVLWFVECHGAYHPRGVETSRATAKLFDALEGDFPILGNEERCAGECSRGAEGEPGLFDLLREHNMATFGKYSFKRVVTSGAHAYDAFRFNYGDVGFHYPLEHTSPFFSDRLDQLAPLLKKELNCKVTYHDSCCLGRHSGFYEEPRRLLRAITGVELVEMCHNRVNSICCGGGGGGNWLDTYYKSKGYERLSERRVKEAIATGADVLASSCTYEIPRFEDALKVLGHEEMVVRDVTELLVEAMEG